LTRVIHRERLPRTSSLLGRHVHHDSESRRYAYRPTAIALANASHQRRVPVFDQSNIGSCTANAGLGCLLTDPFFDVVVARPWKPYTFDEAGAVHLYSDVTAADDYPGRYPPDDTGSDGLTVAKVLKSAGLSSGYQHTFSLRDALLALVDRPLITGINWYNSMFTPDTDGRVQPDGRTGFAGGHEVVADEIDVDGQRVWFTNSWGTSWGVDGRFYMTFEDWGHLLALQGDVTVLVPVTEPAPTPTPQPVPIPEPDDPDAAFATVLKPWAARRHTGGNAAAAKAAKAWLAAKGM
jgi:hypothetical protein